MRIGFVGLSHLGLVSSIGSASKGVEVIGFDANELLVTDLTAGILPIEELDLASLFKSNRTNIEFTSDFTRISECELIYIASDVTTDAHGYSNLDDIEVLITSVSSFVKKEACVVILSQVSPGFCRKIQAKLNLNLVYQVETLVFGNAVERFLSPERFIVGMLSSSSSLNKCHQEFLKLFQCQILAMSYESAELAKIAINVFLASSITTTNTLCELAEKLGADWDDISNSLRLDRRIGMNAYVTPGLGLSGGNIERDLRTTTKLASGLGTENSFIQSIEQNSRHRKLWPYRIIQDQFELEQKMLKIAIWGLAYKKNTNSIKNSPAINNMKMLASSCIFNVFDPIAELPDSVELPAVVFSKILDSLNDVDALIIFNDSKIFSDVPISEIGKRMKGNLIIDPFGMLTMNSENRFNYYKLGKIERKFT